MDIIKILIEFGIIFIVILLLYYFFVVKKCDANHIPSEVSYILIQYKIDYHKINFANMVRVVSLVTSFILALVVTLISELNKNVIISLFISLALALVLAFIFYGFIGIYYRKKSKNSN